MEMKNYYHVYTEIAGKKAKEPITICEGISNAQARAIEWLEKNKGKENPKAYVELYLEEENSKGNVIARTLKGIILKYQVDSKGKIRAFG
jgi:hypothetical protein